MATGRYLIDLLSRRALSAISAAFLVASQAPLSPSSLIWSKGKSLARSEVYDRKRGQNRLNGEKKKKKKKDWRRPVAPTHEPGSSALEKEARHPPSSNPRSPPGPRDMATNKRDDPIWRR